jgi:hypothetical protein
VTPAAEKRRGLVPLREYQAPMRRVTAGVALPYLGVTKLTLPGLPSAFPLTVGWMVTT